jgi:hypothetical protein
MKAYTQKWNLNIKSGFQIIMKSTKIPLSQEIQIYDPLLMGIHFFLVIRCNQELASQISSKSKVLEIFSEFLSKFNSYNFPEF